MDPFIGEIRMFCGNFAPVGWALCNGQLLPISSNQALFAILGISFGGNGTQNFGLPNLQGRVPMHWGNGTGLTPRTLGESSGTENTNVLVSNLPPHAHSAVFTPSGGSAAQVNVTATVGSLPSPVGNMLAQSPSSGPAQATVFAPATSPVSGQLAGVSGGGGGGTVMVGNTGGGVPVGSDLHYRRGGRVPVERLSLIPFI